MSFQIIRNDITRVKADAIVNTANPEPTIGAGTDSAVYSAAGEAKLLAARKLIGNICPGQAIETSGYNLDAKYIIHTVCVSWNGGDFGELDILADCYQNSLVLASELNCKSIAFPLIGTGAYGFPHDDAIGVAKDIINKFLADTGSDMTVMLVLFDQLSMQSGTALTNKIKEYIDDNYVDHAVVNEYGFTEDDLAIMASIRRRRELYAHEHTSGINSHHGNSNEIVDKSFTEKMFELVDSRGIKDSELYGGKYEMYFSKQVLSKMRGDRDYHPSKYVAIVVCLVLKLDLHETLDLLERAGFTLSRSRKADIVVRACIENGIHDYFTVNAKLEDNDCAELKYIK